MVFPGSQACFMVLLTAIAGFDVVQRRVPNALVLAGAVLALLVLLMGKPLSELGWPAALVGVVVGLLAFLPFYCFGLMGAGDVKFFAVLGLWLGWTALLPIWLLASLLAGLQALAYVVLDRYAPLAGTRLLGLITKWRLREIPYACYLAIGAAAVTWLPGAVVWHVSG